MPLSLQIGDDLRTSLACSARQLRLTRAALVRPAIQIYLDNRQDHFTAMVAAERRERATEQAAVTAVIADNRTALAATIKEHLALTTAESKQRALDRDALARQHDGIDRVAEDQQLLIAMLNELAMFQFAIAPQVRDSAVAAVLSNRRRAEWLTKLRDVMVATRLDDHHVELGASRAEEIGRGMIIASGSAASASRTADRNIMDIAYAQGVYRPSVHLERACAAIDRIGGDLDAFVRSHIRRLEALRRAGHAERIDADHWRVPADLPERGQAYDLARGRNNRVTILSPNGLGSQIGHDGATWHDRELVSRQRTPLSDEGFGREVKGALDRRKQALLEMGHATEQGDGSIRMPKDLLKRLESTDIERIGKALAAQRGLEWQPAIPGNYVAGRLVGSTQLSSGRFAMIDDVLGFSLVPWKPFLEQHLGRHISGVAMPGGGVDWSLGRSRGLGL